MTEKTQKTHVSKYRSWFYFPDYDTYFYGEVMPALLWFNNQVKPIARWDLKAEESWGLVFGNSIKYYSQDFNFIYRGEIIDSEDLGNITFGYLGSAMAFSLDTLEFGVWLAGDAAKEGERDSEMIKWGISLFFTDYSAVRYPIKF